MAWVRPPISVAPALSGALAGLAVRNALEAGAERRAHRGKDVARVGQRYAADQMHVTLHFIFSV